MNPLARVVLLALAVILSACREPSPARAPEARRDAEPGTDEARFLDGKGTRRQALLAALTNPDNEYSRQRIAHYGLEERGWDALPVWNARTAPVDGTTARAFSARRLVGVPESTPRLWDGRRPTTPEGWIELGRRVFFEHPLRAEAYAEYGLAHPEVLRASGVRAAPDGTFPGLRVFEDIDGQPRVGITCALCHSAVVNGAVVAGFARREFDYGRLRLLYHERTGAPLDPGLAARMARWGAGRADVTGDESEDPVSIPDLWGLKHQTFFTQAGTLRHTGPLALAVRQETQLIETAHERVRPPREFAWALAMFLYALEPPATEVTGEDPALVARGRSLFERSCARCHSNPAGGGDLIAVDRVGTDPALANGSARGTGRYRPSALVRVRDAGPYLHQGAIATLDDLFDPERLSPGWSRGTLGAGPVYGHEYGLRWSVGERRAIVAWLRTL